MYATFNNAKMSNEPNSKIMHTTVKGATIFKAYDRGIHQLLWGSPPTINIINISQWIATHFNYGACLVGRFWMETIRF